MIFLNSYLLSPHAFALLFSSLISSNLIPVSYRHYLSLSLSFSPPHIRDFPLNLILITFRFYFLFLSSLQLFFLVLFYRFIASRLRVLHSLLLFFPLCVYAFSRDFYCTFSTPSISSLQLTRRDGFSFFMCYIYM